MAEVLNPSYYSIYDTVTVTGDNSTLDTALAGAGAAVDAFVAELTKQLDELSSSGGSKILKFLTQSGGGIVSSIGSQAIEVTFDPSEGKFSVGGVVLDVVGGAAVTAIISFLSPGVILALSAGQAAFTFSLIWSAVKAASELDEDIINLIDGTVPVDIQLVDQNNNVIGGALFEEGLSEEQELEAIQKLLGRTLLTSFPDISIGRDRIRVVEKTNFLPREKEYKVYDGRFVNSISQELGVAKEELLGLGQENSPNTNAQIYYESTIAFNSKSFVFASDENRFFVPLPNTNGGVSPVGLHPGNIIAGSIGNDTLDAFQNRDPDLLFAEQDILLLGLEGDDIINGNVEDDIIVGGKGNDTIDGGFGEDIVIFSDRFKNYDYSILEDGTITFSHMRGTRKDGTDTLKNIELARFKDQTVALPLDEETILNLEEAKDDVTFRFEATVGEYSEPFPRNPGPGRTVPLILEYSFDPELRPGSSVFGRDYFPLNGVLSIDGQSTSLRNGRLVVGSGAYYLDFSRGLSWLNPIDIGGSLFGLELNSLSLSLESNDKDFFGGNPPPSRIPTSADFAQRADSYTISADFGTYSGFRLFLGGTYLSNSFTLESDGGRNTNNNPIAIDDGFSALADTVVSFSILDLLENDSDPDEDTLVFDGVDNLVNGTIDIINGSINFIPSDGFAGIASFDYTVSDGHGGTDTATVTINFAAFNQSPIAVNDSFQIDEDDLLVGNVLLNDSDVDGDELVVTLLTDAKYGSLTLNSDGSFLYFPNNNFNGTDSFTYGLSDGEFTDTATVSIAVATISTSKLQVSLVESKSNFVNELAVFTVDDAAGTINGLVPGSEGYAQAALNRARSVLSTIVNLPNGFDTSSISSVVEFDADHSLRFMLVKNSTLDNVEKSITPLSDLLFSDLSLQQISDLGDSVFPLSWKDSFGNTTDFNDLVLKVEVTTDTSPLGTAIQNESGIELIDLRNAVTPSGSVKAEFSVYREAAFNNYVGFYEINDTDGSITDPLTGNVLKPGDLGYIQTAVGNRVAGIDLEVANQSTGTFRGEFSSGSLFAPFIIINASPTEVLDTNTQNDPAVYFAFLGANSDGVDHIRMLANNVFGFEDLPNGGDLDYNDMVIAANFRVS